MTRTVGRDPEEAIRELLEQRARKLAAASPDGETATAGDRVEAIVCQLGPERYGFAIACVREVTRPRHIVSLPRTPAYVLGMAALRGRILPVLDLAVLLGVCRESLPDRPPVVVLSDRKFEFGLAVDRVLGVRNQAPDALRSDFSGISGRARAYVKGVAPDGFVLLDGLSILADPGLVVDLSL